MTAPAQDASELFLASNPFGVSVTLTPTTGSPVTVIGLFDDPTQAYDREAGVYYQLQPRVHVASSQVPDPDLLVAAPGQLGQPVTVAGKAYRITAVRPDGTGILVLDLQEV